ncbi:formylglycine-generating enzyme family protein [Methanosarcina sp. Mfa9]|uniref:formylglycine-generating enzyme family protein n=1 Tax=Methanosarcina sp. Mfa9 TaxID=3439063 RepID=UPI003F826F1B
MVERVNQIFSTVLIMLLFCGVLGCTGTGETDETESDYTNSIGMEFMKIPAGEFMMGSPSDEEGRCDNEGPVHKVTIEESYYLGKYEVTQEQWREVMGSNPSYFKGDDLPVEKVSWNDVQEFIEKLNEMEGTDEYRLSSEAEWEYACRAGTTTRYYFGDDDSKLKDYAWYGGYATCEEWKKYIDKIMREGRTHPVGQMKPNPWGLYDMHGNVWEWCQDKWHDDYDGAPSDGSAWEDGSSSVRVNRGGGWFDYVDVCRSASRGGNDPGNRNGALGFRVLREL